MDSSELALLLGTLAGGAGGYFGGKNRRKREREERREDILDARELEKEILAEEKYEEDTKRYKREGRFTEGPQRGELEDPGFWDMFGAEHDPVHDWVEEKFGLGAADFFTGTTAYDTSDPIDQRIRNPESENFVENRDHNFLTDWGVLPWASMIIPGLGMAPMAARLGMGAAGTGMKAMKGLDWLGRGMGAVGTAGAAAPSLFNSSGVDPTEYMYNKGGRVEYNQGGIVDLYKKLNRG